MRYPFTFDVETVDVSDEYLKKKLLNYLHQQFFRKTTIPTFWCHQIVVFSLNSNPVCYNVVLWAILFEESWHKNKEKKLFFQLCEIQWMHVWNLRGTLTPTRLRTTGLKPYLYLHLFYYKIIDDINLTFSNKRDFFFGREK